MNNDNNLLSSSKSTRSPATYCFSNDVSVWVAPAFIKSNHLTWLDKGWGNPDQNVVAKTICCWWTCGFAWWLWFPSKNHHWDNNNDDNNNNKQQAAGKQTNKMLWLNHNFMVWAAGFLAPRRCTAWNAPDSDNYWQSSKYSCWDFAIWKRGVTKTSQQGLACTSLTPTNLAMSPSSSTGHLVGKDLGEHPQSTSASYLPSWLSTSCS